MRINGSIFLRNVRFIPAYILLNTVAIQVTMLGFTGQKPRSGSKTAKNNNLALVSSCVIVLMERVSTHFQQGSHRSELLTKVYLAGRKISQQVFLECVIPTPID